jgi:hypothetical protein
MHNDGGMILRIESEISIPRLLCSFVGLVAEFQAGAVEVSAELH